jgi:lipopolysaccharide export system permease protein
MARSRRLSKYITHEILGALLTVFALVAAVVLLVNFIEILRNLDAAPDATYADALWLSLLKAPMLWMTAMPFVFLFGVLVAYVRLNRRSELVAMRAAGVSAWSFVGPAVQLAALFGLVGTLLLSPLASRANSVFEARRDGMLNAAAGVESRDIWMRQAQGGKQFVIHGRRADNLGRQAANFDAFVFDTRAGDTLSFERRIHAEVAELRPGFWQLKQVTEHAPDHPPITFKALAIPTNFGSDDVLKGFTRPGALTFWDLPAARAELQSAGFTTAAYDLKWHQYLATPVMYAAMALLAAAFALRLARLGGLVGLASVGIAAGFGFYFLNDVFAAFATSGLMPPPAAAWIPPLTAILSGIGVLAYTEDG